MEKRMLIEMFKLVMRGIFCLILGHSQYHVDELKHDYNEFLLKYDNKG